jgi:hypothetical protein
MERCRTLALDSQEVGTDKKEVYLQSKNRSGPAGVGGPTKELGYNLQFII